MSISGISPTTDLNATWATQINSSRQRRADLQALAQALKAGDLQGAQQAFATLGQDMKSSQLAGQVQATASTSSFAALGQALQGGDLAGAQKAFAALQQNLANVGGIRHHHHHHHVPLPGQLSGSTLSGSATSLGMATAQPAATGLNVQV